MFLSAGDWTGKNPSDRSGLAKSVSNCFPGSEPLTWFSTWETAEQVWSNHHMSKNMIPWVLRGCRITWGNLRQSSPGKTSSVTSCESKGAWRSRTPPWAAGRWWSPPASRGTRPSGPGTLGRCRSRIPASHWPAATQTGNRTVRPHLRPHAPLCPNPAVSSRDLQKSDQETVAVKLPNLAKASVLGEDGVLMSPCLSCRTDPSWELSVQILNIPAGTGSVTEVLVVGTRNRSPQVLVRKRVNSVEQACMCISIRWWWGGGAGGAQAFAGMSHASSSLGWALSVGAVATCWPSSCHLLLSFGFSPWAGGQGWDFSVPTASFIKVSLMRYTV